MRTAQELKQFTYCLLKDILSDEEYKRIISINFDLSLKEVEQKKIERDMLLAKKEKELKDGEKIKVTTIKMLERKIKHLDDEFTIQISGFHKKLDTSRKERDIVELLISNETYFIYKPTNKTWDRPVEIGNEFLCCLEECYINYNNNNGKILMLEILEDNN